MKRIPFAAQWTIKEDDLTALKGYGRLHSTSVLSSAGVAYCLQMYPYGTSDATRALRVICSTHILPKTDCGKVFVHLGVKLGNATKVEATYSFKTSSAKYQSQIINHVFHKSRAWGKHYCSTEDLFNAKKRFFVDGKMILHVSGIFEIEDDSQNENLLCDLLKEEKLSNELWRNDSTKDFLIITDGKAIKAHKFILAARSSYFAELFESKATKADKQEVVISGYPSRIVEVALKTMYGCTRDTSGDDDIPFLEKLSDEYDIPSIKYDLYKRRNTKLTDYGSFFYKKLDHYDMGKDLWKDDSTKDVTITVDGKEIKAHKFLLVTTSPVFASMLASKTKGDDENQQIEITEFPYRVVKMALKLIYCCFVSYKTVEEGISLMKFFHKFNIPSLKVEVERILTSTVHSTNVCKFINCAIETNASKLQEVCMDYLMVANAEKVPISDIEILDKDVAAKVLQKSVCQIVYTTNE